MIIQLQKLRNIAKFLYNFSFIDIARRKGYNLRRAAVIACTSSTGCLASSPQFRNIKTKPVTIFKDFADRTGHYEECTDPGRKYAGCSVTRKWIGEEYGYSVWCMFMG